MSEQNTETTKADRLHEFIANWNCGDSLISHKFSGNKYTEGVLHVAEIAGAFWLIDEILLNVRRLKSTRNGEMFYVIVLKKNPDSTAVLSIHTDSPNDGNRVWKKKIHFTDFPVDEIKLYAVCQQRGGSWLLMLPREY